MTETIMQYLRPDSLSEALLLKEQYGDRAKLLFGGDFKPSLEEKLEVLIDLQNAGLDEVEWNESGLKIGGLASLKSLEESLQLADFSEALSIEFGLNVRNSLSLSNFLAWANGRSPVLCCLLALNTQVISLKRPEEVLLATCLQEKSQDDHVVGIRIPDPHTLAFESVGRTPKDLPIVCVAASKSSDSVITVASGGTVESNPGFNLHNFDDDGLVEIKSALADAEDEWASAEYRQDVGAVLLSRTLQKLHLQTGNQVVK